MRKRVGPLSDRKGPSSAENLIRTIRLACLPKFVFLLSRRLVLGGIFSAINGMAIICHRLDMASNYFGLVVEGRIHGREPLVIKLSAIRMFLDLKNPFNFRSLIRK